MWDYDVPSQPGLYTIHRNNEPLDVVAVATKTGLIFVLDRETGEPVLPIEERPVPQGGVPGEQLSLTQPFPVKTPPLVPSTLDPENAFGITFWDQRHCRKRLQGLRSEGLYTPPTLGGTLAYPFTGGGANWGSAAYDPSRNLMVVNMNSLAQMVQLSKKDGRGATTKQGR